MVGQVVASAWSQGAVNKRAELFLRPFNPLGGVFDKKVEYDAGVVLPGPSQESFILRFDEPYCAIDDVRSVSRIACRAPRMNSGNPDLGTYNSEIIRDAKCLPTQSAGEHIPGFRQVRAKLVIVRPVDMPVRLKVVGSVLVISLALFVCART